MLPDTATKKVDRRWPGYALAAMGLAALLLGAALLRGESSAPGEELYSPGFKDVAVSTDDTSYPPSDVLRFDDRPKVVYVYLAVEDLPRGGDLEARIEHSGQQSVLSWLLARGDGLEVTDGQEEHLGPSGGGVSGVVKFAVRAGSGEPLPAGDYTVSIYASNEEVGARDAAARKYFTIQDWQGLVAAGFLYTMACGLWSNNRERKSAYGGSQIARVTHIALNVMSLLLVGVGIALAATFFVGSLFPEHGHAARATAIDPREPEVPAITPSPRQSDAGKQEGQTKEEREVANVPKDKTLRVTVPKMNRLRNSTIPDAGGTDENAFRNYVGVHLRGTGFPWQRQANVYIAGHRLGYVGTPSWLSFWDLNEVDVGDKIFVTDSMGRRYVYKVFKDFIVDPTEVFVTRPLKGRNILTLQTCTLPDYSRRLIIQAERVTQPASFGTQEGG